MAPQERQTARPGLIFSAQAGHSGEGLRSSAAASMQTFFRTTAFFFGKRNSLKLDKTLTQKVVGSARLRSAILVWRSVTQDSDPCDGKV